MKASPIQKYALRLLMTAEKIQQPTPASWQNLNAESADSLPTPFGGCYQAIEKTEIKLKGTSLRVVPARGPAADTLVAQRAKQKEKGTPHDR